MIDDAREKRGQPLLFLGLLFTGWVLIRVVTWTSPWLIELPTSVFQFEPRTAASRTAVQSPSSDELFSFEGASRSSTVRTDPGVFVSSPSLKPGVPAVPVVSADESSLQFGGPEKPSSLSNETDKLETGQRLSISPVIRARQDVAVKPTDRWHFDGWLFLRNGPARTLDSAVRSSSYGTSQLGAILSYRHSDEMSSYVRASHAPGRLGDTEGALGLAIRPVASIPVDARVEVRVNESQGSTDVRPAAFLTAGFEEDNLLFGLRTRGYGQAGYVGGEFATVFADGALQTERKVAATRLGGIFVGAGVWGGAQKDASRFDAGPTTSLELDAVEIPLRLSLDYRVRIAGNAQPSSGPAITVSTSF